MPHANDVIKRDAVISCSTDESCSNGFVFRTRTIRKAEGMVQYNLARCPNYSVFESPEWARAEELKTKIKDIEVKAKKRWEANFF